MKNTGGAEGYNKPAKLEFYPSFPCVLEFLVPFPGRFPVAGGCCASVFGLDLRRCVVEHDTRLRALDIFALANVMMIIER